MSASAGGGESPLDDPLARDILLSMREVEGDGPDPGALGCGPS
jgi:hypothetical protein